MYFLVRMSSPENRYPTGDDLGGLGTSGSCWPSVGRIAEWENVLGVATLKGSHCNSDIEAS